MKKDREIGINEHITFATSDKREVEGLIASVEFPGRLLSVKGFWVNQGILPFNLPYRIYLGFGYGRRN